MPRRVETGVVTGAKTPKTRRVEIARLVKHPRYGKYLRERTVCYVHDEENQSQLGDTVEIAECRPMSRTKRWQLVRVVAKSRLVDIAAMRARARGKSAAEEESQALAEGAAAEAAAPGSEAPHDAPVESNN